MGSDVLCCAVLCCDSVWISYHDASRRWTRCCRANERCCRLTRCAANHQRRTGRRCMRHVMMKKSPRGQLIGRPSRNARPLRVAGPAFHSVFFFALERPLHLGIAAGRGDQQAGRRQDHNAPANLASWGIFRRPHGASKKVSVHNGPSAINKSSHGCPILFKERRSAHILK